MGPDAAAEANAVKKLKSARTWLLVIGILYAVSPFLMLAISGISPAKAWTVPMGKLLLISNLALCVIHVGLFFWASTQPFAAAVVGLSLFATVQLVNVVVEPASLTQGLVVKAIFLSVLIGALKAGIEARKLRAALSLPTTANAT